MPEETGSIETGEKVEEARFMRERKRKPAVYSRPVDVIEEVNSEQPSMVEDTNRCTQLRPELPKSSIHEEMLNDPNLDSRRQHIYEDENREELDLCYSYQNSTDQILSGTSCSAHDENSIRNRQLNTDEDCEGSLPASKEVYRYEVNSQNDIQQRSSSSSINSGTSTETSNNSSSPGGTSHGSVSTTPINDLGHGNTGITAGVLDTSVTVVSSSVGLPHANNVNVPPNELSLESQSKQHEPGIQWNYVGDTLALTYIFIMLVAAATCYWLDIIFDDMLRLAECFNIFLMAVQLLWLAVMFASLRLYKKKMIQRYDGNGKMIPGTCTVQNSEDNIDGNGSSKQARSQCPTGTMDYGFGEDDFSLFAKVGGTVLFVGYLLHTGLRLAEYSYWLTKDEDTSDSECSTGLITAMYCLLCLSIFYQIFFAFKFSNLVINKWFLFSKFGIIHCIGCSLCFGIYTLFDEISFSLTEMEANIFENTTTKESPLQQINQASLRYVNIDMYRTCMERSDITAMLRFLQPYFYPFCIQMNLFMVGFWIVLWQKIGKTENITPELTHINESENDVPGSSTLPVNTIIYMDCHASSRGLFSGLFMVVVSMICIVVFFTLHGDTGDLEVGALIYSVWELCALVFMIYATILGLHDIGSLDVVRQKVSLMDDIMLYISLPFIFISSFFSLVPYYFEGDAMTMIGDIFQIIQVILQTLLITNGLRRCSNTESNRNRKPGRSPITFLLVANMAMWLLMAFSSSDNPKLHEFYGEEVWTICFYATLPMTLFYRFHSAVCFADIWKRAYVPEGY